MTKSRTTLRLAAYAYAYPEWARSPKISYRSYSKLTRQLSGQVEEGNGFNTIYSLGNGVLDVLDTRSPSPSAARSGTLATSRRDSRAPSLAPCTARSAGAQWRSCRDRRSGS